MSAQDPEASASTDEEIAASFLLEELRIIDDEFRRLRAEGSMWVARFPTTTAAAVGVVTTLSTAQQVSPNAKTEVALIAAMVMSIVGTNTFISMVVGTSRPTRAPGRPDAYGATS